MPKEQAPWFCFYPAAFLTDPNVVVMTLEECGAYIKLLAYQWQEQRVPSDPDTIARLLHVSRDQVDALWPALAKVFTVHKDGTMTNPRLERERDRKAAISDTRSKAAKRRYSEPSDANAEQTGCKPDANALQTDTSPVYVSVDVPVEVLGRGNGGNHRPAQGPLVARRNLHAAIEWRVSYPQAKFDEHVRRVAADDHLDESTAHTKVWTWAVALTEAWDREQRSTAGDTVWQFWDARFGEWRGTTRTVVKPKTEDPIKAQMARLHPGKVLPS